MQRRQMMQKLIAYLIFAWLFTSSAAGQQSAPDRIDVFPREINLETARDRQSFVVQATYADGITREVTDEAKISFVNSAVVRLDKNVLYPAADGTTEMKVEFAGRSVSVPVNVKEIPAERPISFKLDVMPVFMRAGCNAGSCHGAARGKDGFRLSLFGFDPDGDHYRLTRELRGRRVNLAEIHQSLMLEKPTGRVPHGGGQRLIEKGELEQTLVRWLEAGARKMRRALRQPLR